MPKATMYQGVNPVDDANPLAVQQAQLTVANDQVAAAMHMTSNGIVVPRLWPNYSAPHQTANLNANATANIVTSAQGGGGPFRVHEVFIFSTVAALLSLFDGTPNGTTNLLARLGIAANSFIVKDFKGLIQVTGTNHLVLRNDGASQITLLTAQCDIEILD